MYIITCPTLLSYFDYVDSHKSYYGKLTLYDSSHPITLFTETFSLLDCKIIALNISLQLRQLQCMMIIRK
jgi:hypothetical protein